MKIHIGRKHGIVLVEQTVDNPEDTLLTVFMLGDRKKGYIVSDQMRQDFAQSLQEALNSPNPKFVITHPFVSVIQIMMPKGQILITNEIEAFKCIKPISKILKGKTIKRRMRR